MKHYDMSLSKLLELVMDREARHDAVHGVSKNVRKCNNWKRFGNKIQGRRYDGNYSEVIGLLLLLLLSHFSRVQLCATP